MKRVGWAFARQGLARPAHELYAERELVRWPLGDPPRDAPREPHPTREGAQCMGRVALLADWHDAGRGDQRHEAQDIFAPRGTPVLAPLAGHVVRSSATTGPTQQGGEHVRIRTRTGCELQLSHLDAPPRVHVGERVEAGELLGVVGNSGERASRTCPHLHIGMRNENGQAVNLYSRLRELDPMASTPANHAADTTRAVALARTIAQQYRTRVLAPLRAPALLTAYDAAVTQPIERARQLGGTPEAGQLARDAIGRLNQLEAERTQQRRAAERAEQLALASTAVTQPVTLLVWGVPVAVDRLLRRTSSAATETVARAELFAQQVGPALATFGAGVGVVALVLVGGGLYLLSRRRA